MNPNKAVLNFYNSLSEEQKVPFGHTVEEYRWILEFTKDGKFYDFIDLGKDGKMPAIVENYKRGSGIQPYTLFDSPKYFCGLGDKKGNKLNAFIDVVERYSDIQPVDSFLTMLKDKDQITKIQNTIQNIIDSGDVVSYSAFRLADTDICLHDIHEVVRRRIEELLKKYKPGEKEYPTCIHCGKNKFPIISNTAGKITGFDGAIISNFDDIVQSYGEMDNSGTNVCVSCGFSISYTYSLLSKFNGPYNYSISSKEKILFFNESFPEKENAEFGLLTDIKKYFGDIEFVKKDSFIDMLRDFHKNATPIYKNSAYDVIHILDKRGKTPILSWNVITTEEIRKRVDHLVSCFTPNLQIRYDVFWQLSNFGYYASSQEGMKKSSSGKTLIKNLQKALVEYVLFGKKFEYYFLNGLTKNLIHEIIVDEKHELKQNQLTLLYILKGGPMENNEACFNLGKVFRLYSMAQEWAMGKVNHGIGDQLNWALKNPVNTILMYEKVYPSFKKLSRDGKDFIRSKIDNLLMGIDVHELPDKFDPRQKADFLVGYATAKEEYFENVKKNKGVK